jgi:hypothetical protein
MDLERLKQLAGLRRLAAIKRAEDWARRQRQYAREAEVAPVDSSSKGSWPMAKEVRPDGSYYIPRRRQRRRYVGLGTDGRRYDRRVTAEEDAYLDRVVRALDRDTLTDVLAQAEADGDPEPTVYHAPATGRLFAARLDAVERLLNEPGQPFVNILYEALGLEWLRRTHNFLVPVRRIVVSGGHTRSSCLPLVVVDYDRGENN